MLSIEQELEAIFADDTFFGEAVKGVKPLQPKSKLQPGVVSRDIPKSRRPLEDRLKDHLQAVKDRPKLYASMDKVDVTTLEEAAAMAQFKGHGLGQAPFKSKAFVKRGILRGSKGAKERSKAGLVLSQDRTR